MESMCVCVCVVKRYCEYKSKFKNTFICIYTWFIVLLIYRYSVSTLNYNLNLIFMYTCFYHCCCQLYSLNTL